MKCKHEWISGDYSTYGKSFCRFCGEFKDRITKLSKIAKKAIRDEHGRFARKPIVLNVEDTSQGARLERIENRLEVHAKQIRDLQSIQQKDENYMIDELNKILEKLKI